MPIGGIKGCGRGPPRSGIPVRLAPQNICDVNPYVCRMTPASIDFQSDPPFVGKLSFEPHPRGCQCCAKEAEKERASYLRTGRMLSTPRVNTYQNNFGYTGRQTESPMPTPSRPSCPPDQAQSRMSQARAPSRMSQQLVQSTTQREQSAKPDDGRKSSEPRLSKKQIKQQKKQQERLAKMEKQREKRLSKQLKRQSAAARRSTEYERVRLLREEKRRDDFVTACCTGLLLTPCVSAGSCSEEADDREQANFYIQCRCNPTKTRDVCGHGAKTRSRRQADFPCQCRNCKYKDKGCLRRSGCLEDGPGESPVCYCTDEEKLDTRRQHRVCDDQPYPRAARAGQRGYFPSGDGTVCGEVMPTQAALLTCTQEGDGSCTKMVMTAELMQEMLIKQAQQGVQLANSLLTNKRFQLVDMTVPGGQNISRTSRAELRSQNMQARSSVLPVDINGSNLKCQLQNIDPPVVSGTGQSPCMEPLPKPPLNPYPTEPSQDAYHNLNTMADPRTSSLRQSLSPTGSSKGFTYDPSRGSYKMNTTDPQEDTTRTDFPGKASFQLPVETTQYDQPYQGSIGIVQQPGTRGITGHICIPRDALLQDPTNPKLCIPLSFDPRLPMDSSECPFTGDHAQSGVEPGTTRSSSRRNLQKESSKTKTQGVQKEPSQGLTREPSRGLEQHDSKHALAERVQVQKENSRTGQQDPRRQDPSGGALLEPEKRRSSKHRDSYRDRRRRDSDRDKSRKHTDQDRRIRDSDRERFKRDPVREWRERDPDRERRRRESDSNPVPRNDDEKPTRTKRRHKRSISPCVDSEKRRPSPTEMVNTLNSYETDLLQAMDRVKGTYLKKRGVETSSSKGSSLDSMTPGLAEFNCLLKHITCLRRELHKYSKDS